MIFQVKLGLVPSTKDGSQDKPMATIEADDVDIIANRFVFFKGDGTEGNPRHAVAIFPSAAYNSSPYFVTSEAVKIDGAD